MAGIPTRGSAGLRRVLLAKEVTPGTSVKPATILWRGVSEGFDDDSTFQFVEEDVGILSRLDRQIKPRVHGKIALPKTPATFEQFPYLAEGAILKIGTGVQDGSGSDYIYDYVGPTTAPPTVQRYSIQAGDDYQTEFAAYGYVEDWTLDGKAGGALEMSGNLGVRQVAPNNYTASTIAFTNSHTITDSANGLAIFPVGSKILTSSANNPGPFTVTVSTSGSLTVSETTSTEASGSPFTLMETFSAPSIPAVEEVLFQNGKLYMDAIGGTLGTTQVSNTFLACTINYKAAWVPVFTGDGNLYFSYAWLDYKKLDAEVDITFEHDATGAGAKVDWRANTPKLVSVRFAGSALTTPGTTYSTKMLILQGAGKWLKLDKIGEQDGNTILKGKFKFKYDTTAAKWFEAIAVNQLSSLT